MVASKGLSKRDQDNLTNIINEKKEIKIDVKLKPEIAEALKVFEGKGSDILSNLIEKALKEINVIGLSEELKKNKK